MSKTVSGFLTIGGLIGAIVCIGGAQTVGGMKAQASMDTQMQLAQVGLGVLGLVCVGLFFFGAMRFSRGS